MNKGPWKPASALARIVRRRQRREGLRKMSNGTTLYIHPDSELDQNAADQGCWEPNIQMLFSGIIRPGDTVLDVGANVGHHTTFFSKQVGNVGRVHAFEPVPYNQRRLRLNLAMNGAHNVTIHDCALGQKSGRAAFHQVREDSFFHGNSSLVENEKIGGFLQEDVEEIQVQVRKLDDLLGNQKVDFMKMDIEGGEFGALQGAKKLIRRCHPTMVLEYNQIRLKKLGLTNQDFQELLGQQYDAYQIVEPRDRDGPLLHPFDWLRYWDWGNLLLVPKRGPRGSWMPE